MPQPSPSLAMPAVPDGPPERLAALQKQFSDHIRDPENQDPVDGIEERRLAIYRRLFFNNLSNLFAANFPIARKILANEDWDRLIRAFMVKHRPTNPLFPEIGREFVRFLAEHPEHYAERWPWLAELCHWQFQATAARNDESRLELLDYDPEGELLDGIPLVNPTLRMAQYQWPVWTIRANRLPDALDSMVLAIWRKPDDTLGRMKLNLVTARLLEILQANSTQNGQLCLNQLAGEMQHPEPDVLVRQGQQLLQSLRDKQLVLGVRID
ncbi:MAG: putative DNA-binding domain-containing protein [Wenzhouxiangellaceae bacterium]|nr:putative DNA-binding domain-containing protein [Wenzhouxiangellaceae bacterium]